MIKERKLTLKALRNLYDLNQAEAGRRVGVSEDTWRSWEKGKTFPDVPKIMKIEEEFDTSYNDIIFLPPFTVKPLKGRDN